MTRYLISFDEGAVPSEELPAVVSAARAVAKEARDAGVWVFGGALTGHAEASDVNPDGTVAESPYSASVTPLGGLTIVDVPSRDDALAWAAKIAAACRCAQEVREFRADPGA